MKTFREFVNQCLAESDFEDPFEKCSNIDRVEQGFEPFKGDQMPIDKPRGDMSIEA